MIRLPKLPETLFGRTYEIPANPCPIHAFVPDNLMVHVVLGWNGQEPERFARLQRDARGRTFIQTWDRRGSVRNARNARRALAAASVLEGAALERTLSSYPKTAEAFQGSSRAALGKAQSVHLLPSAPDGEEFLLIRKNHLHPVPERCGRAAMLGGVIDRHERLLWSDPAERAIVAVIREAYEELADPALAEQFTERMRYLGPFCAQSWLPHQEDGIAHLFTCRAETGAVWKTWKQPVTTGGMPLEGTPFIIGKAISLEMITDEQPAFRAYEQADPNEQADRHRTVTAPYRRQGSQTEAEWFAVRKQARDAGAFPLLDRRFRFVSGHGLVLKEAFAAAGCL